MVETGRGRSGPTHDFNTNLNFSLPGVSAIVNDSINQRAKQIINRAGCKKGYCLVIGSDDADLLIELARNSNFSVISVQSDDGKVNSLRDKLYRSGVQGSRVNVLRVDDLKGKIPLTSCMINLLISFDRKEDEEIKRVLVPGRGRAIFISRTIEYMQDQSSRVQVTGRTNTVTPVIQLRRRRTSLALLVLMNSQFSGWVGPVPISGLTGTRECLLLSLQEEGYSIRE